jgi:hypothetical protein
MWIGSGTHPTSYPVDIVGYFSGVKQITSVYVTDVLVG